MTKPKPFDSDFLFPTLGKKIRGAKNTFFLSSFFILLALLLTYFYFPDKVSQVASIGIGPICILYGIYLGLLIAKKHVLKEIAETLTKLEHKA